MVLFIGENQAYSALYLFLLDSSFKLATPKLMRLTTRAKAKNHIPWLPGDKIELYSLFINSLVSSQAHL